MAHKKLIITIEKDDELFIVGSDWPLVHGDGLTFAQALQDYIECVQEWAELVRLGAENNGNEHDKRELEKIRKWRMEL